MKSAIAVTWSLCLAGSMLAAACGEPAPARPNIILVTLDTTRADALGIYGRTPSPSPNVDDFAALSTVYEHAYAPSSWTLPTHASLFTGLLPSQHGAGSPAPEGNTPWHVRPLASEFTTLAELLAAHGYRTAAVIGGPALARELGTAQGFQVYDADFSRNVDMLNGKRAEYVTNRAIELVESFGSEPYFLFLNFFDPHRPYAPPRSDRSLPEDPHPFDAELFERLGTPAVATQVLPAPLRAKLNSSRTRYHAEVSYMDAHVGRMLDTIDASSGADRPLVIITSDHGESFGEHNFSIHGLHLYEDNVHVPLVIRWPDGRGAGRRIARPAAIHRIFALVLRELGIEPPGHVDVAPLDSPDVPVVTQLDRMAIGIQLLGDRADRDLTAIYTGPYKLIESSSGEFELFDLERDPLELNDLAPADPERARELRRQLASFMNEHAGPILDGSAAELSEDTEEALRALGYLQ
jgi:arylsulfatase A-like enzyme